MSHNEEHFYFLHEIFNSETSEKYVGIEEIKYPWTPTSAKTAYFSAQKIMYYQASSAASDLKKTRKTISST